MDKAAARRRGVSLNRQGKRWVLRWRDYSGIQRQQTVSDKRTAERLQGEIRACLESGRDWIAPAHVQAARRVPELSELATDYLKDAARRLAPRTLVAYGGYLDLWTTFAQGARLELVSELSREALVGFWDWLRDPVNGRHGRQRQPTSASKVLEVVRLMWTWGLTAAAYRAHLPPCEVLDLPRRPRPRPVAPTWAELDRMLGALAEVSPGWTVRVAVLARALGERRSAILRLRWSDLYPDEDRLWLDVPSEITKGGASGRVVPLPRWLEALVATWGPPGPGGALVGAPALELTGRGHVDRTLRRAWKRSGVRAAAWEGQPVHGARVTIRSTLAAAGVQGDVIDAYLGHAGQGAGSRHYTDRAALRPSLVAAADPAPRALGRAARAAHAGHE